MDGLNRHKKVVGERIKLLRGDQSQTSFAAQLKISVPALQRYEYGVRLPRGPMLERMAALSGKSVDWILLGKERDETDRVAESPAVYKKPRVKEIAEMLEAMDKEDVEEVFRLVQDKKQAAAWRREKKLKEG